MNNDQNAEEWWHNLLTGKNRKIPVREARHIFSILPAHQRCQFCNSPFDGSFAPLMHLMGRGPSRITSQFCQQCQTIATEHIGGAEIEVALLFADVRGSTKLGERMGPVEFSRLISRFFSVSSKVLLKSHAWVDKLVGDQVIGMYIPYYVGSNPERAAIESAQALLRATGHADPGGPWIEVGVGVHSGLAFIGVVGSHDGATDITVLGDVANVAARLSSAASSGEILVSEAAHARAELPANLEKRVLELKGKSQPLPVYVLGSAALSGKA